VVAELLDTLAHYRSSNRIAGSTIPEGAGRTLTDSRIPGNSNVVV
jgi:hypothetical protein